MSATERAQTAETWLRMEWWADHGDSPYQGYETVHSRYGDDGEMQCCGIDFKRLPIAELHRRVKEGRERRVIRQLSAVPPFAPLPSEERVTLAEQFKALMCRPVSNGYAERNVCRWCESSDFYGPVSHRKDCKGVAFLAALAGKE